MFFVQHWSHLTSFVVHMQVSILRMQHWSRKQYPTLLTFTSPEKEKDGRKPGLAELRLYLSWAVSWCWSSETLHRNKSLNSWHLCLLADVTMASWSIGRTAWWYCGLGLLFLCVVRVCCIQVYAHILYSAFELSVTFPLGIRTEPALWRGQNLLLSSSTCSARSVQPVHSV